MIAPTRDVDAERLGGILYPDRRWPDSENSPLYHSATTRGLLDFARKARAERAREMTALPKLRHSMDTLLTARAGSKQLTLLEELLPTLNAEGEKASVQLAVAAYRAGVGTAANFALGGFDTHAQHDMKHPVEMGALLDLINLIWQTVDEAGIAHRTIMLIHSDFGRTRYCGDGKNDRSISSMIVVSGLPKFMGARNPLRLDPQTLEPLPKGESGVIIRPEHVHRNLRNLVGMMGSPLDQRFPLTPEHDLKLF